MRRRRLVVGLFAPPLLAATAIGAGIGAVLGHLTKKHEENQLGVELDNYDKLQKALDKSSDEIGDAIDS